MHNLLLFAQLSIYIVWILIRKIQPEEECTCAHLSLPLATQRWPGFQECVKPVAEQKQRHVPRKDSSGHSDGSNESDLPSIHGEYTLYEDKPLDKSKNTPSNKTAFQSKYTANGPSQYAGIQRLMNT
jgi:hypothetical protein